MADINELEKILRYIEENIRVTEQTSIEYIDPRGHKNRLKYKQNQVVFGRRGSGKSLLLKSIKEKNDEFVGLHVNLEDYKDISFPDSIIQILRALMKQLKKNITNKYKIYKLKDWFKGRLISKALNKQIKKLSERLYDPDNFDESVKTKSGKKKKAKSKLELIKSSTSAEYENNEEKEVSRSLNIDKLKILRNEISDFKELIQEVYEYIKKPLFLILDDFYFIKRSDQPFLIDYFHKLCKNTEMYFKVATIKHRSSFYLKSESYIGIELTQDAQSIDLDYNLERLDSLIDFMKSLIVHIKNKVNAKIEIDTLFTDNAFKFLCLASGGVPRDFLALFLKIGNKIREGTESITKPLVIEISMQNLPNKMDSFKTDTDKEGEILGHYLNYIKNEIIELKRSNAFLVSNSDIAQHTQINQALKELVDLRLLHISNANISSAPSDGKRYSAYLIDIGLYPNARPRDFRQVEPGEKDTEGREDKMRSSPKLDLDRFDEYISNLELKTTLTLTEY